MLGQCLAGKWLLYTGLVDTLQLNDNEIAVVMGHEMAHALKEHGKAKANFGTMSDCWRYWWNSSVCCRWSRCD